jgi:Ni/Fe-hydrogenase subunit HybB-like protein
MKEDKIDVLTLSFWKKEIKDLCTPTFWKIVFVVITVLGLYSLVMRFVGGLGAVAAINDNFPWGLWTGLNKLGCVGLAGGGFVICGAVHIFNLEKYKPIVKPTVLVSLLGYLFFGIALTLDLGLPWRIWHPVIFWNPHSFLFEIAWCVILYLTVLCLEFLPVVLEKFRMKRTMKFLHFFEIGIVIAGIVLSTLHQSSLGSMFLITPTKLHPFWYTVFVPLFFYISAIGVGLSMIIFTSFMSYRTWGKTIKFDVLNGVAKAAACVFFFYFIMKIYDYSSNHVWHYFAEPGGEKWAVIFELLLGVIIPMCMFASSKVRRNKMLMFVTSLIAIVGFMANRVNITITGMQVDGISGLSYVPHYHEIIISIALFAWAIVIFALIVKYLPVYGDPHKEGNHESDDHLTHSWERW